jgi:hypothetical protein
VCGANLTAQRTSARRPRSVKQIAIQTTHSETPHKPSQKKTIDIRMSQPLFTVFLDIYSLHNAAPSSLHTPFFFLSRPAL